MVEILITIFVMLILSSISIPVGISAVDYLKLKTTGDQIKNLLKVAQSKALADPQIHCGMYLFPGTGSSESYKKKELGIFFDLNSNYLYDSGSDELFMGTHSLPDGVTLSIPGLGGITDNVIVFRGDGSAKFGGAIILTSIKNRQDSIHVLASTGRIKTIIK